MAVVDGSFDHPLKLEENASLPLAGGIMQYGYQCGMVWGAALAAGAEAYRRFGAGPQAETGAIAATRGIVDGFQASNNTVNCLDITGIDKSSSNRQMTTYFFLKGGVVKCFRMAARYAPVAFSEINTALADEHIEAPSPPVSCAAVLAQKVGVSDMHTVMTAGLAGGIGLSGGGCGALGAAVWIIAMNSLKESVDQLGFDDRFKDPRALDVIDRFAACTDSEFECAEIVGRRFKDVDDHAAYLRDGGCSKIIEVLAAAIVALQGRRA
jgi:hypothetical protein